MNSPAHLFEQGRDWLDDHGKPAWIATMVLGFVFFWPVGLFVLFYMIGTNRMGNHMKHKMRGRMGKCCGKHRYGRTTGNSAFDAYREETLKRLEDEQNAFQSFLQNLREAKDRAEFDEFMNSRKDADTGEQAPA